MAIWNAMLVLISWLFVRDGGFHQFHPLVEVGIMGLFWLFGLGGSGEFFGLPMVRLSVEKGGVTVRERWLLRARAESFPVSKVGSVEIVESKDSEGAPYFRCVMSTPGGRKVVVKEGGDKLAVVQARERLLAAIV